MTYFKNTELAGRYNIAEGTVRNWIKSSKDGNNPNLTLEERNGRFYVAKTPNNIAMIERLVEANKKYRNTKSAKVVTPRPEFYRVFSQAQIYDIVRNLELHHEIPRQYNYFDGGAGKWDEYVSQLAKEETPNLLNRTESLISENWNYLSNRLAKFERINVVDVGVGNAMPVRELLGKLLEADKLGRYIAIDISNDMLKIAEKNIAEWFGGKVKFEGYDLDITYDRFANILAEDYLAKTGGSANLVLLLGGTPYNFRNPDDAFRTINESMNINDLLVYTDKLETPEMHPEWMKYETKHGEQLAPRHRLVFDLLEIDESFYDVEIGYDAKLGQRYSRTRLKVALTLKFDFDEGQRVISFEKGETILLWRSWQMTPNAVVEQLERNGFYQLHSSQTEDHEFIISVSEVKQH